MDQSEVAHFRALLRDQAQTKGGRRGGLGRWLGASAAPVKAVDREAWRTPQPYVPEPSPRPSAPPATPAFAKPGVTAPTRERPPPPAESRASDVAPFDPEPARAANANPPLRELAPDAVQEPPVVADEFRTPPLPAMTAEPREPALGPAPVELDEPAEPLVLVEAAPPPPPAAAPLPTFNLAAFLPQTAGPARPPPMMETLDLSPAEIIAALAPGAPLSAFGRRDPAPPDGAYDAAGPELSTPAAHLVDPPAEEEVAPPRVEAEPDAAPGADAACDSGVITSPPAASAVQERVSEGEEAPVNQLEIPRRLIVALAAKPAPRLCAPPARRLEPERDAAALMRNLHGILQAERSIVDLWRSVARAAA